jgi:hypothetical protein
MSDHPSASWPVRTEIECAARIIENMKQDIRDLEDAVAPSRRSTRFQRALDGLKGRVGAAQQCMADAVTKLDFRSQAELPITPCMPWEVVAVEPLPSYRLRVEHLDGTTGIVDMSARVRAPNAGVFAALADEDLFRQVYLQYGAVTWPGELDLAPDAMHDEIQAHGEWVLD